LKTISSHPSLKNNRNNRWDYLGLVNEPCFDNPTGPDPNRFGLWLDKRRADCPADPFENEQKYPGVKYGARGKNIPAGSYYGYATGIVGLRLFPNPDFDEAAQKKWDAVKYYTEPDYYNSKDLIRPYRVGMSCGFCHVGPNPVRPPADRNHPEWENLSSNVGAQYFWTDRIFFWNDEENNFAWQLFHTYRPGTLDTSLVSSDNIVNPRSMNALYQLLPRLLEAKRWNKETLHGGELNNHQLNDYVKQGPLTQLFQAPDTVWTPARAERRLRFGGRNGRAEPRILEHRHIQRGVAPALQRAGGRQAGHSHRDQRGAPETRRISSPRKRKPSPPAEFFLKTTDPHYLRDAPGGDKHLTKDKALLNRGKIVFAENCARCHSSKLPENAAGLDPNGCNGKDYLGCWDKYWAWTQTDDFKAKIRPIVLADDFLKDNYLSAEFRVPVTLLRTNACSPLATNAIGGNIWDNFSSHSYKDLPSVGDITWYHPVHRRSAHLYHARGRTRVHAASVAGKPVVIAPFLLNNSVDRLRRILRWMAGCALSRLPSSRCCGRSGGIRTAT